MTVMAKRKKKRGQRTQSKDDPSRAWLPDKSSVVSEKTMLSPKGKKYRVITTTEMDPYDRPENGKEKKAGTK
jgi:hypothetical protein